MSKAKLFVENFLVYGFGGIISKIIPLIMLPIITRIMPTKEYVGLFDMSNTVISFASALAIMGMYDAMYRMFFEKDDEEYKKNVCSTALIFTIGMSIIVLIVLILIKSIIARYFFEKTSFAYLVYFSAIATLVGSTNSIIAAPTRMQNKRKVFLITNTISPIISYAISIPMLLAGYYVIALPLAAIISGLVMEVSFYILNNKWFELKRFDKKLLKELLVIAVPLFPNFLIYWIFNSSDKLMITNIIGIGEAGVYGIGSKLGHASQLIYTAFAGGWQYFAFSTMKEKDQVKSNSIVFEYLGVISYTATLYICALCRFIFKVFPIDYQQGYIIAPYLFLAPLLLMLFQVAANQFIVIKKTWPNMLILFSGAIINVFLNLILIPLIGIEGASIATLCGYIVSDIVCMIVLCKMKLMVISSRFIITTMVMALFFIVWRLSISDNTIVGLLFAVMTTLLYVFMYRSELQTVIGKLKSIKNMRKTA